MASESIVDQYIDSLFVFDISEPESVALVASTIDAKQSLVPTFKTPNQLGQFMLMAQQLLALASQMPPSRLKQHCLDTGMNALCSGAQLTHQGRATNNNPSPSLNDLLKLNTLLR
ncbi:hypothetical protein [Saccharospirillum sp. MSK14-1]|uniref:hypothetical protein n=1 Tax=Saccharospirillum sp. MSK14-1 TaxID=1897632 RepID=UPI0011B28779|nr:hypothetical protein [Saccharospirillum sp. MSK14-1]